MTPFYADPLVTLYLGDCLDVMRELPDASVDSVVTDPPYGLEFMGKEWDSLTAKGRGAKVRERRAAEITPTGVGHSSSKGPYLASGVDWQGTNQKAMQAWHEQWATEAFRVLKPGGYLLAFGGTRTYHRLASAIEDAGFEIRDTLMWIYASGFPKSLDVSKALDKVAGAERPVIRERNWHDPMDTPFRKHYGGDGPEGQPTVNVTGPATDLARKWEGWGTALKPAHEPIVMARKPLVGTVAQNVTRYGTGAINVDGCRIATTPRTTQKAGNVRGTVPHEGGWTTGDVTPGASARWPSNVLLSDPELFDEPNPWVVGSGATTTSGAFPGDGYTRSADSIYGPASTSGAKRELNDSGGYSRFFIIPKADRAERERGLRGAEVTYDHSGPRGHTLNGDGTPRASTQARANVHPTVKPIDLMRHLVRLVTPPGGVCLDPFLGSGTTALAASEEGFHCIGIEREPEYLDIAKGRLMATPMGLGLDAEMVQPPRKQVDGVAVRHNSGGNTFGGDNPKPPMADMTYRKPKPPKVEPAPPPGMFDEEPAA